MKQRPFPHRRKSVLLSFKFLGIATIGSLSVSLVCAFAALPAQIAVLGMLVSVLAGLLISFVGQEDERERRQTELVERLTVPLELAPEHDLFDQYTRFCAALADLSERTDPILREFAVLKLASVIEQVERLAQGVIVFSGTETWRAVYEQILKSPDITKYYSVAWVKTRDYWQDQPGRQSMLANFEAAHRGTLIERTVLLRDDLWPKDQLLPSDEIRPWIAEQHNHGLWVTLVRESAIASEPDLLADVGIYGNRAIGIQELDERCRTIRFVLDFNEQNVRLAKDRWRRLSVYAISYRDLLDQLPPDE